MAIGSMGTKDYKWFTLNRREEALYVTRSVFLTHQKSRKGTVRWHSCITVNTIKEDMNYGDSRLVFTINNLRVNGTSVKTEVISSLGNSGDISEQRPIRGYIRLEAVYDGVCYRTWLELRNIDHETKIGKEVYTIVDPVVSAILTKRVEDGTHSLATIYKDYRDCVLDGDPLVLAEYIPVGKKPPLSKGGISGEKIAVMGEVWTRIGKTPSRGTTQISSLLDVASFARKCPVVTLSQAVVVSDNKNTFTLRAGRYVIPPNIKWWELNIQSISGTLNRAKNSFASAHNVSLVGTNKLSAQRALRRI